MITRKSLLILLAGLLSFVLIISCSEDKTSTSYETHPDGWMNPNSEVFHGQAAIPSGGESCGGCHWISPLPRYVLAETNGGSYPANGNCAECHDNYPHLWDNVVPDHQNKIHALNWDLQACGECHGSNLSGGEYAVSCLSCHTDERAFTNCNLCHATPPIDNAGLPEGFNDGAFGAHEVHSRYACTECHATVTDLSHIDGIPAEVSFAEADIANRNGHMPVYAPGLDPREGSGGCGSVYCHGNATVNWRGGPVACGSCHSIPPASVVHDGISGNCHQCHPNVDPASNYSTPDGIFFVPGMEETHVNGVATVIFPFE